MVAYLKQMEPQRESFDTAMRDGLDSVQIRLDYLEGHIAELEARLDEVL